MASESGEPSQRRSPENDERVWGVWGEGREEKQYLRADEQRRLKR